MKQITKIETIEEFQKEQPSLYRHLKADGVTDEQIMDDLKIDQEEQQAEEDRSIYLIETIHDKAGMAEPFIGVKFTPIQVALADRLEIWGSKFTPDLTPDYCLYRLMFGVGTKIAEIRRVGF